MESGKRNWMFSRAIALATALTVGSTFVSALSFAQTPPDLPDYCSFHNAVPQSGVEPAISSETAPSETTPPETVIVIGKVPNAPYVVVVPRRADDTLNTVRQCVPDAFQTRSSSGSYIHAGAFSRRSDAEELSRYLRSLQLDARVLYLP